MTLRTVLSAVLAAVLLGGPLAASARADSGAEANYKSGIALKQEGRDDEDGHEDHARP